MTGRVDEAAGGPNGRPGRVWYIYPPAGGPGLGRYWRAYALAKEWRNLGLDPLVIAPGYHHQFQVLEPRSGFEDIDGAPHYFLPTPRYGMGLLGRVVAMMRIIPDLAFSRTLSRLGRTAPPDVVIYSSPYPFGVLGAWWLARRYKSRFIFEVRDIWPLSLTEILRTPRWHPFVLMAGFCEFFAHRTADRVVSLLRYADRHMVRRGMAAAKFAWIPNGVESSALPEAGSAPDGLVSRRAAELKAAGDFVVIHAGNMGETTPLGSLLSAATLLRDRGRTDIRFLLVGRGDQEAELKARAAEAGLDRIDFMGQVDRAEVIKACQLSDLGYASAPTLPIYEFGLSPNKVADYMLAGLPILFANTTAENQVTANPGTLGCEVDDPEAIALCLERMADMPADERRAMGQAGRRYLNEHLLYRTLAVRYVEVMGLTRQAAEQGRRQRT